MPCLNCKFSEPPRDNRGQVVFGANERICKRNPPQIVVLPSAQGISINTAWPTVPNNAHCFCYELSLAIGGEAAPLPGKMQ